MKNVAFILASLLVAACASAPKTDTSKNEANSPPGSPANTSTNPAIPSSANAAKTNETQLASGKTTGMPMPAGKTNHMPRAAGNTNEMPVAATETNGMPVAAGENEVKSVYFDFDSSVVQPSYKEALIEQAATLISIKDQVVVLEGNADERGSSEYNLALGNRRAHAVKMNLAILGVAAARIKVVSFGKEKPRLTCHEEKCWQENRRVDFVIKQN